AGTGRSRRKPTGLAVDGNQRYPAHYVRRSHPRHQFFRAWKATGRCAQVADGGPIALPFEVPRELFPVEHRFVTLNGARIHYIDEGSGQALLLLHGRPSWCFLYGKIIAALKSG